MTSESAGHFALAMDTSGTGDFMLVGIMQEPSLALSAVARELRNSQTSIGLSAVFIQTFAARISGRCIFNGPNQESAVRTIFSNGVVMDWRIAIPETGVIQALFLIKRLDSLNGEMRLFDVVLELAGRPVMHPIQAENERLS